MRGYVGICSVSPSKCCCFWLPRTSLQLEMLFKGPLRQQTGSSAFILKQPRALRVPPCEAVCVGFHARHFQLLLEHKGFFSVGPTTSVGLTPVLATIPYQPTPRPIFRLFLCLCFPAHVLLMKLYSCNSKWYSYTEMQQSLLVAVHACIK